MKRLVLASLLIAGPAWADDGPVDYTRQVKPIFKARCYSCHGSLEQEAGLRLDTAVLMQKGGDSGPAVVAGALDESLLLARITEVDPELRMPPEGHPLTAEQLAIITRWIAQGANAPAGERPEEDPRSHWAFQRPVKAELPHVQRSGWIRNPIDAFIAAEHERRGLVPLPPADKRILLRRVYLDLIGLPPTRDQLRAFLADDSADAYERVVDGLLDSQQYGERWGRHWMDVWRYSDWYGRRQVNDVRNSYPHIWRWRDWIVQSLNEDKGYAQMLREMLAADELYPEDDTRLPALGFIVRNWFSLNYDTWKQDLVEHTGKAFLGLRLNCAHCHDHKYDPITQEEYFRFRAFFEPLEFRHDRVPGGPALTKYIRYKPGSGASLKPIEAGLARVYDFELTAETKMYRLGDTRDLMERPPVSPGAPAFLDGDQLEIRTVELPAAAWYPALKEFAQRDEIEQRVQKLAAAEASLSAARSKLESLRRGQQTVQPAQARAQESTQQRQDERRAKVSADEQPDTEQPDTDEPDTDEPDTDEPGEELVAAQRTLTVLTARRSQAQAELAAIRARVAADKARFAAGPGDADALARRAVECERAADLAAQRAKLAAAENVLAENHGVEKPAAKTVKQAQADVAAARKAISELEAKTAEPTTDYTLLGPQYPKRSSGRRRALADWIANRNNPLTARVAVNHIWMRHFGRPLVESVADFGRSGQRPTHPELLDWLAVELMESQTRPTDAPDAARPWAMKHLHRLIVTSNTYRLSSRAAGEKHPNLQVDKDNVYWWKFERQRMQAETIRDSMLYLAGRLDLALGGQEIAADQEAASQRRSMYFAIYPEAGGTMQFMSMFDAPNPTDCYRRSETVVPQQALAMANSAVALSQGRHLADKLSQLIAADGAIAGDDQFILASFEQILCRPPTEAESQLCREFLRKQRRLYLQAGAAQSEDKPEAGVIPAAGDPMQRSRQSLVRTLLNHNDFVTIH